jgi:hypothetical protein
MKKLFMFLFVVIMSFGIVGSPLSDALTTKATTSSVVTKSQIGDDVASTVSTPAILLLLGFGMIFLAEFGRKINKK